MHRNGRAATRIRRCAPGGWPGGTSGDRRCSATFPGFEFFLDPAVFAAGRYLTGLRLPGLLRADRVLSLSFGRALRRLGDRLLPRLWLTRRLRLLLAIGLGNRFVTLIRLRLTGRLWLRRAVGRRNYFLTLIRFRLTGRLWLLRTLGLRNNMPLLIRLWLPRRLRLQRTIGLGYDTPPLIGLRLGLRLRLRLVSGLWFTLGRHHLFMRLRRFVVPAARISGRLGNLFHFLLRC